MRQHVNLMAKEILFQEQVISFKPMIFPLILILGLGTIAGWTIWELRGARILEERIKQLTGERQRLQQEMSTLTSETQSATPVQEVERPLFQQQLEAVNDLLRSRILWSDVLRQISLLVPKGIYLTRLETIKATERDPLLRKGGQGIRFVGFAQSHTVVASFMAALEQSRYFADVVLMYAQKSSEADAASRVGFELVGHLQRKSDES